MRKVLKNITLIILVGIIIYCLFNIVSTLNDRAQAKNQYASLVDKYVKTEDNVESTNNDKSDSGNNKDDLISLDIQGLEDVNKDFVAWIYFDDGKLNYPIVQEQNDELNKYLDTAFEGNHNSHGCLFISNNSDVDASNLFVYGHNMKDGTMMGSLKYLYNDPSGFKDKNFCLYFKDGSVKKYTVFALYVVDKDSSMYTFRSNEYMEYVNSAIQKGGLNNKDSGDVQDAFKNNSQIVTLSTCYGSAGTRYRLLVHGVETEKLK